MTETLNQLLERILTQRYDLPKDLTGSSYLSVLVGCMSDDADKALGIVKQHEMLDNIKVCGLAPVEIARLHDWFQNQSGRSFISFWEEAFNAGVKQTHNAMKREPDEFEEGMQWKAGYECGFEAGKSPTPVREIVAEVALQSLIDNKRDELTKCVFKSGLGEKEQRPLLRTVWKDSIDIEEPSLALETLTRNIVNAYEAKRNSIEVGSAG